MRKFVALLAFALAIGGIGQRAEAEEQLSDNATIIIQRENAFVYSRLAARISINGEKKIKVENGKTAQLSVSPGRNVFEVKGFMIAGSSTITFDCKSGETYELKVSPRKGTAWAGALGAMVALSMAAANAEVTDGGGFRIVLVSTSDTDAPEVKPTKTDTLSSSTRVTDPAAADENANAVDEDEVVKQLVETKDTLSEVKEDKKSKPSSTNYSLEIYEILLKLDDLRQRGILTEEEFQNEKKKVLDGD